jgi:hypothetical protein
MTLKIHFIYIINRHALGLDIKHRRLHYLAFTTILKQVTLNFWNVVLKTGVFSTL